MDILGQSSALHYLSLGITGGRLSPSLLFVGPEGTGKRSCALEVAKCFACTEPAGEAPFFRCDRCSACSRVDQNNHSDILVIDRSLQAALLKEKPESQTAIKIESIRHLDKFLSFKPLEGRRRVVIVDEAHRMTGESANALLKLLEEPPNNAQLILIAFNEHTVPSTILSRCAIVRFRPAPSAALAVWLENRHAVSSQKAVEIAARAGGSFSKALLLKDDETAALELSDYTLDEFFTLLAETNWRKEGRKNAETAITHLIEASQKKLHTGDFSQTQRLEAMLTARRQLDRNVPAKLVLATLYVKLECNS